MADTGNLAVKPEVLPPTEVCDGLTDEDLTAREFYTGPTGTQGVGICQTGVQRCVGGVYFVVHPEVLPSTELCDGIDDNCDGLPNEAQVDRK